MIDERHPPAGRGPGRGKGRLRRWIYGLVPVALIFLLRVLLEPVLEDKSPFLLFTLAVMLAAAIGGLWAGAIATLFGGIAGLFFLASPWRGLENTLHSGRWLQPLLYLLVCGGVSYLIEALHRIRRRAEANAAEQSRLAQQLGEANRAKDEFLAVLSHELRTPLSAIVGWANLLRTRKLDPTELTRAVEVIHRNAMVQKQLISDILDVARITSGKLRLEPRPIDPALAVAAAVETVRPAAQAKEISLEVETDPGSVVWGDPDRLQQVVWNLLSNAVKFTPASGRVTVRLVAEDSRLRITVADTGCGLRPEFIPHAFERFRQDDVSSTRSHSGLGLGLAIVRHLVELQGGTVMAANRSDGPGAVFEVVLPRMAGTRLEVTGPAVRTSDRHELLAGVRVLVVDDEPDARNLLGWILKACGADVVAVQSVSEALDALKENIPDVILTDIAMPERDGYDLLRNVQSMTAAQGKTIAAAAISASAGDRERARALAAGFQVHLAKPVDPDELAAAIRRITAP